MKLIDSKVLISDFHYDKKYYINKLYLKQYLEHFDSVFGDYYVIKAFLYTNQGNFEIIYSEGYNDKNILEDIYNFLTKYEGIANLLNRIIIELESNTN